jgi:hypothetical protein
VRVRSCLALPNRILEGAAGTDARSAKCTLLGWISSRPFTGDDKVCACAQGALVHLDVFSKLWLAALLRLGILA